MTFLTIVMNKRLKLHSNKIEIIIVQSTVSSQFLLASAISKHLDQYENLNPMFVKFFLEDLYVNDSINGASNTDEAYHRYQKSKDCLLKGGFEIQEFYPNDAVLQGKISRTENSQDLSPGEKLKILGNERNKVEDILVINLHNILMKGFNIPVTKRSFLKLIVSIYDTWN